MMALSRRRPASRTTERSAGPDAVFGEADLRSIEAGHPDGMSVQEVVDAFVARGARLTEATFRKYVQLGLIPRSTRVGRKGKHRGSQGLYPSTAVRQIDHIRRLMGQGISIEDIQREFLFVRGDVDALERQLERIYSALERAMEARHADAQDVGGGASATGATGSERGALGEARVVGADLLSRLEAIERRLALRARMARAVV